MGGLTKCSDTKRPSRGQCRRYADKASPLQSCADFHREQDEDKCADGFVDNNEPMEQP